MKQKQLFQLCNDAFHQLVYIVVVYMYFSGPHIENLGALY